MNYEVFDLSSRFDYNNGIYLAIKDSGKNLMLGDKSVYVNVKEPYDVGLIKNGKLNPIEDIMPIRYLYGTELRRVLRKIPSEKTMEEYYIRLLRNDLISILRKHCKNK